MSQTRAAENLERLKLWIRSKSNADFKNYVFRGELNKKAIAQEVGFSRSSWDSNPALQIELNNKSNELRQAGILPQKTEAKIADEKDNIPKVYDATQSQRAYDKQRLQQLEQEVIELKAKLRRYQELSEVLTEMGLPL